MTHTQHTHSTHKAHTHTTHNTRRYAERLPIGLESIIKGVPASTVKGFYDKWYSPERMAVIAVGDFEDPGESPITNYC